MPEFIKFKDRLAIEDFRKIGVDVILGSVEIDNDKCIGCKLCSKACAAAALEIVDKKCKVVDDLPFCMACGDCVAICPEDAIKQTGFIQFTKHFRYVDRGVPEWPRKF